MNYNPIALAFISCTESALHAFSLALQRIIEDEPTLQIETYVAIAAELESSEEALAQLKDFIAERADFAIITTMGGKSSIPHFDEVLDLLLEPRSRRIRFHVEEITSPGALSEIRVPKQHQLPQPDVISRFLQYGGVENFKRLLRFLGQLESGVDLADEDLAPVRLPRDGIYHPSAGPGTVLDLDEYLDRFFDPARPVTVGITLYSSFWIDQNLYFVDALVEAIEKQGANALPVFYHGARDEELGLRGVRSAFDLYFRRADGTPLVDAVIRTVLFSMTLSSDPAEKLTVDYLTDELGVPFIQAIVAMTTANDYAQAGLSPIDVSCAMALPEFDGTLIGAPVAAREQRERDPITGAQIIRYQPFPERCEKLARLAINWGRLRKLPNNEKRIAVILHNYPPDNSSIGSAFGLDAPTSVVNILRRLQADGYRIDWLPEDGDELINEIIARGTTNDSNWMTYECVQRALQEGRAVTEQAYMGWFQGLPEQVQSEMVTEWEPPPGEVLCVDHSLLVPGILNGNVFVGVQPARGYGEDPAKIYHNPALPPPHYYLAFYWWLRNVFDAHLIIHVGTHGTLEWLPGKGIGLSERCYSDIAIGDLPHLYPYIINVPSEGTQAKRHSYACLIDHMIPPMTAAESYDDLAALEVQIEDYYKATQMAPDKLPLLRQLIWEQVVSAGLHQDLQVTEPPSSGDFSSFLERLHGYLAELKDAPIREGLHRLGEPPTEEALDDMLVALTRLDNGSVPSLRQALVEAWGYDYEACLGQRGASPPGETRTYGDILHAAYRTGLDLMSNFRHRGFAVDEIPEVISEVLGPQADPSGKMAQVLDYVGRTLVPKLAATVDELEALATGAQGRYIRPGPSGSPTRGMADILPTGRNFYSLDPYTVPTQAAWRVGVAMGDALLERFLQEQGRYPESVGMVVWGEGIMRTGGDDIAEILYLIGVAPTWNEQSGQVAQIRVIPLKELGRPRIDVSLRIDGIRYGFPNVAELLDEAFQRIADLDEPIDSNFLRKHALEDADRYRQELGLNSEEAWESACWRIFGDKMGTYGTGIDEVITARNWEDEEDLTDIYVKWGGFVYGKGKQGRAAPEQFRANLARIEVVVRNQDSREYDMFDSDDFYAYQGGMIASVTALKGEAPTNYFGDASDPERPAVRPLEDEAKRILRTRVLNPKWVESMRSYGYRGATEFAQIVDTAFGWDATSHVLDDWSYERITDVYVLDEEMQKWFAEVNPYALQNMTRRLLEAIDRDLWDADDEMRQRLRQVYLSMEGVIEEAL